MLEPYRTGTYGQPWDDFADPGNVRPKADGTLNAVQQRDMEAI